MIIYDNTYVLLIHLEKNKIIWGPSISSLTRKLSPGHRHSQPGQAVPFPIEIERKAISKAIGNLKPLA